MTSAVAIHDEDVVIVGLFLTGLAHEQFVLILSRPQYRYFVVVQP
jgi:hypothetical protein